MDSRATIIISFDIYDKKFKTEFDINYSPSSGNCGIDYRIEDWFDRCYQEAFAEYQASLNKLRAKQDQADREKRERAQLARLKEKYE